MIHERNEDTDNSLAEGGQRVVSLFLLGCIEEDERRRRTAWWENWHSERQLFCDGVICLPHFFDIALTFSKLFELSLPSFYISLSPSCSLRLFRSLSTVGVFVRRESLGQLMHSSGCSWLGSSSLTLGLSSMGLCGSLIKGWPWMLRLS